LSPDEAPDLTPHPLTPREEEEAAEKLDALTKMVGFIGSSKKDGRVRVYLDMSWSRYIEVSREDVVRTAPVDASDEQSPTVIWVKASAQVGYVTVKRLTGNASFVKGAIQRRYSPRRSVGRRTSGRRFAQQRPRANEPPFSLDPCTEYYDCFPPPPPTDVCPPSIECLTESGVCSTINCPTHGTCPTHGCGHPATDDLYKCPEITVDNILCFVVD